MTRTDYIEIIKEQKEEGATIYEAIDNMVIYYRDCLEIIRDLRFYNWEDSEFPVKNIAQLAFAALLQLCEEEGLF